METNTVCIKLPLWCYACFNTCYYRFHLVRWAWKRAFGPSSEFITNSQFVLKYRCNLTSPKTYLARWQNPFTLGYRTLKFPCTLRQRVDLSLSIMLKKNFSVIQKYAKNYWVLIFQSEFLCLKLSLPLQSRARIGEKIEKKKRLLCRLLLLGQDYRWNLWKKKKKLDQLASKKGRSSLFKNKTAFWTERREYMCG